MTGDGASRAGQASSAMYGHVEERDGVVVQFMLGGEDAPDTVDNVDAHIYLSDGTHRYATFFTTEAINALLRKDARTGETGGGRYFWCSDQVIVPRPGVPAMMEAVTEMIRSGDITFMCGLVDDGSDEDSQSRDQAPSDKLSDNGDPQ